MEIKSLVKKYQADIQALRRLFHQYPELSFKEVETTKMIAAELDKLKIPYKINPEKNTGLVAVIEGTMPGKKIALRSDIDALNVTEESGVSFSSCHKGKMHACGHDAHIAILLGAAKILMDVREQINGTVYLIFQPAEELGQGSSYMMKFGDWFKQIDNIFGGHVWIDLPAGQVSVEEGERMAAGDQFTIKIHGHSGHGSQPHQTTDAVVIASAIVMNLQTIVSRHYNPLDSVAVTIASIHSGTRFNIIAGEAVMEGITRYFRRELGKDLKDTMERIIMNTAKAYGATAEFNYVPMIPPTINDPASSKIAAAAVEKVLGKEHLSIMQKTTGGEDFAFYMNHKPGCFAFFGIYNPSINAVESHHSPKFNLDDTVLAGASGVYAQYAVDWLNTHK
ncbi:M20 metallopeptidase family protein [Pectinatus sottacetonis]|uniref:M20 metallopeptidase family protein n=1 Tax=Pectinatus sottacetonis TaxID=1002795 RepID=UPI0018C5B68C|nr:amidohydrolase [Pectinatus sottacetonis]